MSMDREVKITVLMSVYNTKAKLLSESISSILNQSYKYFEYIIIDDGSDNDETIRILQSYSESDSRIKCVHNPINIGLTKSLNIGLSIAKGIFIARMDDDDVALPNRLEQQINFMEEHPEITILGSDVEKFGVSDKRQSLVFRDFTQGSTERFRIKMFLYNAGPVHSSVMIRRAFLDENNISYRESIKKAQDYALWIDCLKHGGVIYNLPIILLRYRMHEGQITAKNSEEQIEYTRKIVEEQLLVSGFQNKEARNIVSALCLEGLEFSTKSYIDALKQLILWNKINNVFNEDYFEQEVRLRWLNKIIKNLIRNHKIEPFFHLFSIQCVWNSSMLQWIKIYILKRYL